MNRLNIVHEPVSVEFVKDTTLSCVPIQNTKTKQFENKYNASFKKGEVIITRYGYFKDQESVFKVTEKGYSVKEYDYAELTRKHEDEISSLKALHKQIIDGKDFTITKLTNEKAEVEGRLLKLQSNITDTSASLSVDAQDVNVDNINTDDTESVKNDDPSIPLPAKKGRKPNPK